MVAAPIMLFPLIPFALFLFFLSFGLLAMAWIWMLISAAQNKGLDDGERVAWVLVVALLHFVGAVIYFLAAYRKRHFPLPPKAT